MPASRLRAARLLRAALLLPLLVSCAAPAAPPPAATRAPAAAPAAAQPAAAPAKPAAPARPIVIAQGIDVQSLHPYFDTSSAGLNVFAHLYSPLVTRDKDLKIVPALAESWKPISDTTWEFKLRKGVKTHDGGELKASDVKFSLDSLLDPANKAPARPNLTVVKATEVVDDYTVRITTSTPNAILPNRLTFIYIVPEKAVTAAGGIEGFAKKPVGSGPYRFVEYVKDDHLSLEAFPDYWGGAPKIQKVTFRPIAESSTRVAALRTGEADLVVNVPPQAMAEIDGDAKLRVAGVRSLRVIFIGMNTTVAPLTDKRVRQALNYAVDVDSIVANTMGGQAFRVPGPFGPSVFGYDPSLKPYPYDVAKAKSLLAEAGFPNGIELPFAGPAGRYLQDKEIAETVSGQLAKAGIRTKLNVGDWNTFWPDFLAKKHQGLWLLGLGNSLVDADYYYYLYFHTQGRGYYGNPELDALITQEQGLMDPEQRKLALQKIMRTIYDDAPWLFLFDQRDLYGVNKRLTWEPRSDEVIQMFDASAT